MGKFAAQRALTCVRKRFDRHQRGGRNRGVRSIGALTLGVLLVAACTPQTSPEPVIPQIKSLTAAATSALSPALVTIEWSIAGISDSNATCTIESDEPGAAPITVAPCRRVDSRNIALTTDTAPTIRTVTLTVTRTGTANVFGSASFTVEPGPSEPFNITLGGLDGMDPRVVAAAQSAAARWEQAIIRGIPDNNVVPSTCAGSINYPVEPALVDDLFIHIAVENIDGSSGILAQAGPDCFSEVTQFSTAGEVTVDLSDVDYMDTEGTLSEVLVHEIGHVLGIGTLWDWGIRSMIAGSGTSNPLFTGRAASAEWHQLGGIGDVPVENSGSAGTAGSHWRELTFGNEMMTGWADPGSLLSRVSIAAMADFGYQVDLEAADLYSLPGNAGAALRGHGMLLERDVQLPSRPGG